MIIKIGFLIIKKQNPDFKVSISKFPIDMADLENVSIFFCTNNNYRLEDLILIRIFHRRYYVLNHIYSYKTQYYVPSKADINAKSR